MTKSLFLMDKPYEDSQGFVQIVVNLSFQTTPFLANPSPTPIIVGLRFPHYNIGDV